MHLCVYTCLRPILVRQVRNSSRFLRPLALLPIRPHTSRHRPSTRPGPSFPTACMHQLFYLYFAQTRTCFRTNNARVAIRRCRRCFLSLVHRSYDHCHIAQVFLAVVFARPVYYSRLHCHSHTPPPNTFCTRIRGHIYFRVRPHRTCLTSMAVYYSTLPL